MIGRPSHCAHTLRTKSPIPASNIPCYLNCGAFVVISSFILWYGKKAKMSSSHVNFSSTNKLRMVMVSSFSDLQRPIEFKWVQISGCCGSQIELNMRFVAAMALKSWSLDLLQSLHGLSCRRHRHRASGRGSWWCNKISRGLIITWDVLYHGFMVV